MASDQALEPINVATSGIERVHFQRFCIRLLEMKDAEPRGVRDSVRAAGGVELVE